MRTKVKKTGAIAAADDKGRRYTIEVLTTFQEVSGLGSDSVEWEDVATRLRLDTGEHVNPLDDGRFQVLQTGTVLRRL